MMHSYENNFEDVPLVVSTPAYERAQRKRSRRNIFISIGLIALAALIIILVSTLSSSSTSSSVPQVQKTGGTLKQAPIYTDEQDGWGVNEATRTTRVLRVKQGRLRGAILKSRKGRDYSAFFSIPYGQPPINDQRFEFPQPAGSWEDEVYDSTKARAKCVSRDKTSKYPAIVGTEDCLHLHIATPKIPTRGSSRQLPVMAFIYGGGFKGGYASRFDPKYFMDEDIIIVLIEYRSGVFGHLNTGDGVIGGNLSLKDQSLALRWIRDNIEAFGGNPNRVILGGNSAGGMSVHAHILSEMSRGLFHAAISQSGVALGVNFPDVFLNDPGSIARRLGEVMNCSDVDDSQKLAKCLKEADVVTLANVNRGDIPWGLTGEVVPPNGDKSQIFLQDKPMNIMRNGDFAKVPWLVGVNSAEEFSDAYDLLQNKSAIESLNRDWAQLILEKRLQMSGEDDWVDREIRQFYFNGSDRIGRESRYALTNLISDRKYVHPTRVAAMLHSKHVPVFLYYMSRESNFSLHDESKHDFPPPYGAAHGDELQYLFIYDRYPQVTLRDDRFQFSEDLVKIWVSFAHNFVPDGMGVEPWNPIQESQDGLVLYQLHDKPLRKNIQPFTERMKFWDKIVQERNLYG